MSSLPNLAANTSNNNVQQSRSPGRSEKDQLWRCLPLHCALLRGDQCDLELAARPLGPLYKAWDCKITRAGDTTLHVIVGAGKWFNDPTVGPSAYTSRNNDGHTPLCVAAMVGNMEAAKNLLQLNPGMGSLDDAVGPYPIIEAARYGHKEMVLLLIGDMERKLGGFPPTKQSTASHFLHLLVLAGFYGNMFTCPMIIHSSCSTCGCHIWKLKYLAKRSFIRSCNGDACCKNDGKDRCISRCVFVQSTILGCSNRKNQT